MLETNTTNNCEVRPSRQRHKSPTRNNMKAKLLLQIALAMTVSASADPLHLFNSGTDTNGLVLPIGSIDPHITIVDRSDGLIGTSAYTVATYTGHWIVNDSSSLWLSALPDPFQAGNAEWTYRVPIDLTG